MGITKVRLTKADIIAAVRDENYGDSDLSNFANLSGSGLIERKSEGVIETVPVTDYIKTLLNDATAADARSTMGLGSMATASTSSYQPLGNELTAIQALSDTPGFLKKTGDGSYSIDNNNYLPLSGGTLTNNLSVQHISQDGATRTSYFGAFGIDLGQSYSAAGFPFIDFHSGGGMPDFDARIQCTGGYGNGENRGGSLKFFANNLIFYTGDVYNPSIMTIDANGNVSVGGILSGNGSGLTSLNASNISTGTLNAARLPDSGVTAGTYNNSATQVRPFAVDAKGRITGVGTPVDIAPPWSAVTGKPTTLNGYGITNGQPLGNELTAIQALSDTPGFLKKTGDGSYSIDNNNYLPLSGGTVTGVTNFSLGLSVRSQGYAPLQLINLAKTEAGLCTSYAFYNMKSSDPGGLGQNCFSIYTYTNNDTKSIPFVILDNDNVGIGTTAPTTKLDVGGSAKATSFFVGNNQVVSSRKTGWSAPTGTGSRTTFATSTVTLSQLAERVKALIDDLTNHGLIGV